MIMRRILWSEGAASCLSWGTKATKDIEAHSSEFVDSAAGVKYHSGSAADNKRERRTAHERTREATLNAIRSYQVAVKRKN